MDAVSGRDTSGTVTPHQCLTDGIADVTPTGSADLAQRVCFCLKAVLRHMHMRFLTWFGRAT